MERDVLIVEDEKSILQALEASLRGAGYGVLTASSKSEAEKILAAHPQPQDLLLLIDVALKGESGLDLASSVSRRFPTIRVLLISGYIDELVMLDSGLPVGHVGFLSKPFTNDELLSAVRRVLA